jgi:integrase/recombinase XerD
MRCLSSQQQKMSYNNYCLIIACKLLISNASYCLQFSVAQTYYQTVAYTQSKLIFEGNMAQAATLNEAQIKRALRYCQSRKHTVRDHTILLFSIYTGLRAKELAALCVGDVFDADGAPRTQFTLSAAQTKGARTRTVFVNRALAQQLTQYALWRSLKCCDPTAALFPSQKGGHFSANTMCQLFLNIYKACGLSDASSHSGRRTFITRLANKGVGVRVLAALAGHSSISVTQRYIDVNDVQLANAVELL